MEALKESVKEAHRELSETKKIEAKELQELRDRLHQIHGLKGIIEGARLTLRIQSDEKISLAYQEAGKPEDVIETAQGMSVEKRHSGGFTLSVKGDRKSTRLNCSHFAIALAVFCLMIT